MISLERLVNVIKTNTDLLKQSLRKLGELSSIEGGNAWLLLPPGSLTSHPSLAAAVSSIEDPASVIDHTMQGMRTSSRYLLNLYVHISVALSLSVINKQQNRHR
jgi:hypothetical protein